MLGKPVYPGMSDIDLDPGSPEAVAKGCTCPLAPDGPPVPRGSRDLDWDCPLHGLAAAQHAILTAESQFNAKGEQLGLNSGEPFSKLDDLDIARGLEQDDDIDQIATFLCRTPSEINERMTALGLMRVLNQRQPP
jgi:hypothetical protein